MFTRIKQLFAPPAFEDEEKTRLSRLLHVTSMICLTMLVLSLFALPFTTDSPLFPLASAILGILFQLGVLFLLRRRLLRLASLLLASTFWVVVTMVALAMGGISGPVVGAYVIIILIASLLLGGRTGMGFAALSVAGALGILLAETSHVLPWKTLPVKPVSAWITQVAILGIAAGLLWQATRSLSDALERARRNERGLAESNRELQALRVSLEQQVEERTMALRASEAELRALFAAMSDVILVLDAEGRYLRIAPTNPALLYKPPDHLIGKTLQEVFPAAQANLFFGWVRCALETRQPVNSEYSLQIGSQEFWFSAVVSPMLEDTVILVARDITERKRMEETLRQAYDEQEMRVQERTAQLAQANQILQAEISERKQAEEALRESQSLYRSLVEVLPQSLCRKDLQGRFTFGNRRYCATMNKSLADIVGKTDWDLHPAELADKYTQDDRRVIETGQSFETVEEHVPLGGEKKIYVQTVKSPIRDAAGALVGVQVMFWDITEHWRAEQEIERLNQDLEHRVVERTAQLEAANSKLHNEIVERKQAEQALRESEERFRTLYENAPIGIYRTTPEGRVLMANPAHIQMVGCSSLDELASLDLEREGYAPGYSRQQFKELIEREGEIRGQEYGWVKRDGSVMFVRENARVVRGEDGTVLYYDGTVEDITERKLAEEALNRRLAQLALLSDVGKKIAAVLELESVLNTAAHLVQESFGYHHVGLFTVDRGRGELVMRARAGQFAHLFPSDHRIELGQGVVGWTGSHGERLLANDVRTESRYTNFYPGLIPTQSELCVPIRVGNETVGVLDVQSPRLNAFDQNDVMAMETLANQIAVAIENARLYESVQRQLAERKRADEAVMESEKRFHSIAETAGEGIIIFDGQESISYWNTAAKAIFGYSGGETLGKLLDTVMLGEFSKVFRQIIQEVMSTGGSDRMGKPIEATGVRKDGSKFPMELSIAAWKVKDEVFFTTIVRDITERKRAEESLRRSEEAHRALFEQSADGIVIIADGRIARANQVFCALHSLPVERVVGMNPLDLIHLEDRRLGVQRIEAIGSGEPVIESHVYRALRADSSVIWAEVRSKQIEWEGKPALQSIVRDITERRRAEEALRESEERYRVVAEQVGQIVYDYDVASDRIEWSGTITAITGYTPEEFRQVDVTAWEEHIHPEDRERTIMLLDKTMEEEGHHNLEYRFKRKDGTYFHVEDNGASLKDQNGKTYRMLGAMKDITGRKQDEEALKRRAAQLALLSDVGKKISAVLELESVLDKAAHLVQEGFGYHHVGLFTVDRERGELVMRARAGQFAHLFPSDHRIELGQGVVGWTGSHGERLLANDVRTESRYTNFYPDLIPTQSELCVPIRVGNETVGVLDVQSPQLDVFDQNDVRVIETLADQIAVAIENARLYEAVRRELAERKRAEEHSAAFSALGQRLNSTTNPEEAARIIVGVADQLVGWDACFLSLYSAEEDLTYLVLSVDIINGQRVDIHTGVVGETPTPIVRRTMKEGGQLILRNQAAEYADVVRFGDETRLSASLMFVPIRNVANIIGVLSIQSYTPMAYDQESLGTLRSLADHCGGALERIRAEDQLRRFSTELAQSNEELKRFTYTISHDLRAPLVNLKGFAGELALALKVVRSALHAVLPQLDEEHRSAVTTALLADVPEALGFIDASVTRMDHYINALLKLSRLGRRELVLERVDMEALTQATLETLAYQIEQRQARVTAGPLPAVVADRTALEQIMSNLLNNALIYLEPGRAGEIEISGERNAEETLFHVRDNGRGIAQEDMDKVFAPFRRAGKQDVPGEGMGLAYVQALVRRHGGRIGCESELGVGTTFTFTLPH